MFSKKVCTQAEQVAMFHLHFELQDGFYQNENQETGEILLDELKVKILILERKPENMYR